VKKQILEVLDRLVKSENEGDFNNLLRELTLLIEDLKDCVYIKAFFWAARSMMEKRSFSEKKKVIKSYKKLFAQIEGECKEGEK